MGLDAIVYKRLDSILFDKSIERDNVRVVASTGEVYAVGDAGDLDVGEVIAVRKRLGNITMIESLREAIKPILGDLGAGSLLLTRVLYSGTHSGDVIQIQDLNRIRQEIALIRETGGYSPNVGHFLSAMEELVAASEHHENPIVFA